MSQSLCREKGPLIGQAAAMYRVSYEGLELYEKSLVWKLKKRTHWDRDVASSTISGLRGLEQPGVPLSAFVSSPVNE